jgi:hypothetical protein
MSPAPFFSLSMSAEKHPALQSGSKKVVQSVTVAHTVILATQEVEISRIAI